MLHGLTFSSVWLSPGEGYHPSFSKFQVCHTSELINHPVGPFYPLPNEENKQCFAHLWLSCSGALGTFLYHPLPVNGGNVDIFAFLVPLPDFVWPCCPGDATHASRKHMLCFPQTHLVENSSLYSSGTRLKQIHFLRKWSKIYGLSQLSWGIKNRLPIRAQRGGGGSAPPSAGDALAPPCPRDRRLTCLIS